MVNTQKTYPVKGKWLFFTIGNKGGVGKSYWILLKIFLLAHYFGRKQLYLIDLDSEVQTTTRFHSKEFTVESELKLSEDHNQLWRVDPLFDPYLTQKDLIGVCDLPAGKVSLFSQYWDSTGQHVAKELSLTAVALYPLVRTKESLAEATALIEQFSPFCPILIGKNLVGTGNDREVWSQFYAEPSIRKIASRLQSVIDDRSWVYELFLPEIPSSTYSTLLTQEMPLGSALEAKNPKLRFAERIRLQNLIDSNLEESFPILQELGLISIPSETKTHEQQKTKDQPDPHQPQPQQQQQQQESRRKGK